MAKCEAFPMFRYTWPGQDEAMVCLEHAFRVAWVAEALGMYLQFIPLEFCRNVIGECSQEVPDDDT